MITVCSNADVELSLVYRIVLPVTENIKEKKVKTTRISSRLDRTACCRQKGGDWVGEGGGKYG